MPDYYSNQPIETINKQEMILQHLEPCLKPIEAYELACVIKYIDRMGKKKEADPNVDAYKAANYLHRLIKGEWIPK